MVIVDKALEKIHKEGKPIQLGIIGTGYMGSITAIQIINRVRGIKVAAISNRTISKAFSAYEQAGISDYKVVETDKELAASIAAGGYAVVEDAMKICSSEHIDVVIDATSGVDYGAHIALTCFENKIHLVSLNADVDATVGPLLKVFADRAGVIYTGMDGDQPGVIMNLLRYVDAIGYNPVLAGNIKGLHDPYRNPDTQRAFAEKVNQQPQMITSFADGTKISMEMVQVANATGFKTGKRGMYGYHAKHVNDALGLFTDKDLLNGGLVDYILGAEPGPGVFVIGHNDNPVLRKFMNYVKMGEGPFYLFYRPYHLAGIEVHLSVARAALFGDATIVAKGAPVCGVISILKKNLEAGTVLDGIGGFTNYGMIENEDVIRDGNLLPMGLSEGCVLKHDMKIDQPINFDDVVLPAERLIDRLYREQISFFP